jgi:hypothetical protein
MRLRSCKLIDAPLREGDGAGILTQDTDDRLHQCALARAVRPKDRNKLAGLDRKVDTLERRDMAVAGLELFDPEHHTPR